MQVGIGGERAPHRGDVLLIGIVIDRIGLRLPDHAALADVLGPRQTELHELPPRHRDEVRIGQAPQRVVLEAEIFQAEAGEPRIRHHLRRPALEVLDAAHLHARLVDIDPVVIEQPAILRHQRDDEEIAIAQRRRGPRRRWRWRRPQAGEEVADRRRGDDVLRGKGVQAPVAAARRHPISPAGRIVGDFDGLQAELHGTAPLPDPGRRRLPHHAGTPPRIAEALDQRGDELVRRLAAPARQQGSADRRRQREVPDPLRGAVGRDLRALHAPHLLGVGLEEDAEQSPAEAIADPLLEVARRRHRRQSRARIGQHAGRGLDRPELGQDLESPQGIGEELAAVVDARLAGPLEQIGAEDLAPQRFDGRRLREEAMAADIEMETRMLHRPGDPADMDRVTLDDGDRHAPLGQQIGRGQAGWPRADADDRR